MSLGSTMPAVERGDEDGNALADQRVSRLQDRGAAEIPIRQRSAGDEPQGPVTEGAEPAGRILRAHVVPRVERGEHGAARRWIDVEE